MISINDMQYLVALAQENHFRRAAAKCNISQPALSSAIAKLETQLGFLLFERLGRGIRITPEGKALATESEKVLVKLDAIRDLAIADKDQLQSPIQLGCDQSLGAYLYPQILVQLQHQQFKERPAKIYLHEKNTEELIVDLHNGFLDSALIVGNLPIKDCVVRELFSEPWQVLLPLNHPFAVKNSVSFSDLKNIPLLIASSDFPLVEEFFDNDFLLEKVSSYQVLRGLVSTQIGLGLMPFIAANSQLYTKKWVSRPMNDLPNRKLTLVWRASYPRYKMMEILSQTIKSVAEWQFNFVADEQHQVLGLDYLQR